MSRNGSSTTKGLFLLLGASFIWGTGIVAQKLGAETLGAFTFNALRCLLGLVILIPMTLWFEKRQRQSGAAADFLRGREKRRALVIAGVVGGLGFFGGATFQQLSLAYISAGKSGFLTALYIVFLPLAERVCGKKTTGKVWLGIGLALVGLYLLCVKEGFSFGKGDILGITGAFFWTFEILTVDRYCRRLPPLTMMCAMIGLVGVLSLGCAFLFEEVSLAAILPVAGPVLYAAVMLIGVAYTLQAYGQQTADPTLTGLIFSLEAVFSVLAGTALLHETMTPREITGCVLMFIALLITQIRKPRK